MWKRFGAFTFIAVAAVAIALSGTVFVGAQGYGDGDNNDKGSNNDNGNGDGDDNGNGDGDDNGDDNGAEFVARLSGDNEVPEVDTESRGLFRIVFEDDTSEATFMLVVDDGEDLFMAHIHCGDEDENGPIAVWLAGRPDQVDGDDVGWDVDGIWVGNATVTDDNVISTDCGDDLEDLREAIEDGDMYANVHNVDNPAGVIRGQLE